MKENNQITFRPGRQRLAYWNLLLEQQSGEAIEEALDRMNPVTRMVIVLHYGNGYSHEEIAALMCAPVSVVRNNDGRGIHRLFSYFNGPGNWRPAKPHAKPVRGRLSNALDRMVYWEWLMKTASGKEMERAMDYLQPDTRLVLLLHYGEGHPPGQVAELMCLTTSKVVLYLNRGMHSLFRHFEKQ